MPKEQNKPSMKVLYQRSLSSLPAKDTIGPNDEYCNICGVCTEGNGFSRVRVVPRATIMFLVPFPIQDRATVGAIYKEAKKLGIQGSDLTVVPVLRGKPKKATITMLRACRPYLLRVLEHVKPKYIVAFGEVPASALENKMYTKLTKRRGIPLVIDGYTHDVEAYATYGIEHFLETDSLTSFVNEDVTRYTKDKLALPDFVPLSDIPGGHTMLALDTEFSPQGEILDAAIAK